MKFTSEYNATLYLNRAACFIIRLYHHHSYQTITGNATYQLEFAAESDSLGDTESAPRRSGGGDARFKVTRKRNAQNSSSRRVTSRGYYEPRDGSAGHLSPRAIKVTPSPRYYTVPVAFTYAERQRVKSGYEAPGGQAFLRARSRSVSSRATRQRTRSARA